MLWYSLDQGTADSWVEVPNDPEWGEYDYFNSVCGPSAGFEIYGVTGLKIYGIGNHGIWRWNGDTWSEEYEEELIPYSTAISSPYCAQIWCNDADTLVVATSMGTSGQWIIARPGVQGSAWYPEFNGLEEWEEDSTNDKYSPICGIHGTSDGETVVAVTRCMDSSSDYHMVLLQREPAEETGSAGTWTEIARREKGTEEPYPVKIQVVSDTEIYVAGLGYDGSSNYVLMIWKWDGSDWSVEYTGPAAWDGLLDLENIGLWVNPDGTDGWASCSPDGASTAYVYFDGTSWTLHQEITRNLNTRGVTQVSGEPYSARAVFKYSEYDTFEDDDLWTTDDPETNDRKVWAGDYEVSDMCYIPGEVISIVPATVANIWDLDEVTPLGNQFEVTK